MLLVISWLAPLVKKHWDIHSSSLQIGNIRSPIPTCPRLTNRPVAELEIWFVYYQLRLVDHTHHQRLLYPLVWLPASVTTRGVHSTKQHIAPLTQNGSKQEGPLAHYTLRHPCRLCTPSSYTTTIRFDIFCTIFVLQMHLSPFYLAHSLNSQNPSTSI